ncbi:MULTISPECIES: hypothetical protein [unclassified Polaromonas]|uniref:hypothetical protein n=1 Tax=unclassified Polaromonas TaxID=2638319 RepID=UPI000F0806CE|nr:MULTISPECIES: hypothetical protein [unclassified Polaromonas]AYQ27811.1 hypothetical protein DT070_07135 [Polaromonas sp. SP1]QGJ17330.1 hypothetical protein F7R28_02285 [Polaromonas sp. Pch-P]
MAIGWLAVLQLVPWSDVINNAPKIAEGAKKLWSTVGKKPPVPAPPVEGAVSSLSPEAQAMATLQARVTAMEETIAELHGQMLASSELIKTLADQNTQLIQRIEVNRVRLLLLAGVTVVLAVAAGLALALGR